MAKGRAIEDARKAREKAAGSVKTVTAHDNTGSGEGSIHVDAVRGGYRAERGQVETGQPPDFRTSSW